MIAFLLLLVKTSRTRKDSEPAGLLKQMYDRRKISQPQRKSLVPVATF